MHPSGLAPSDPPPCPLEPPLISPLHTSTCRAPQCSAPTLHQLDQAVEFSLNEAADGRPVFIHCAHGHGRSATVMAACFLEGGMADSIEPAEAVMKVQQYANEGRPGSASLSSMRSHGLFLPLALLPSSLPRQGVRPKVHLSKQQRQVLEQWVEVRRERNGLRPAPAISAAAAVLCTPRK